MTELGYFIAKIENTYMQTYLQKFDKLFKGKQSIDIEFFDENPLSIKYVRYNQSGAVCQCIEDSNQAKQKTKNGWQPIACDIYNCQYRQKNEQGKCACNRLGWLKFLIPSVSTDRIFLMKITGQTSINKLDDYITLQKAMGNSVKGRYTLFLQPKEQVNSLGQTFNNYVLDILKTEDFISEKQTPQPMEKPKKLSTENDKIVNNNVVKQEPKTTATKNHEPIAEPEKAETKPSEKVTNKTTAKENSKRSAKSKTKKFEEQKPKEQPLDTKTPENTDKELSWDNIYILHTTYKENIKNKSGQEKEYLIGRFFDMEDTQFDVLINPNDEARLQKCNLGTFVKMDIKEVAGRHCAMKIQYLDDTEKNIAA